MYDNKFSINTATGVLSLVNSLDYETRRSYRFEVKALNNYDGEMLASFAVSC